MSFNKQLETHDPDMWMLINEEYIRQKESLELIASENFTSGPVLECLGSVLTNKYSEGLPGKRYYGGNEFIDKIETLCIDRAKKAFHLDDTWGVNVQPYSGSTANLAVYLGLINPGDTIMGLDLPSGGHLTHGYQTPSKKISASAIYYNSVPYKVGPDGYMDYLEIAELADKHRPRLIICGASAYPRDIHYNILRDIANACGAYLMCDMAHTSGLIASGLLNNPFEYCDVVTTTTHKSLRGPRSGIIFFKKCLEDKINFAVFPSLQGGPHNNQIGAVATQLLEVDTPEFKEYSRRVIDNAKSLAIALIDYGYTLSTGGTDNHLVLVDLKPLGITGSKVEKLCDVVNISLNKNSVPGDTSALSPGGIRIGTPAMTSRGMNYDDFKHVAMLINRAIQLALKIQKESGLTKLDAYVKAFDNYRDEIDLLRADVSEYSRYFDFYN